MSRYARLAARVADLDAAGLRRRLRPLRPTSATTAELEGRRIHLFSTNDYLGLANHPAVEGAWRGGGAGAARLVSGDRPVHHQLEERLEALYGRPALLFPTGFQANLGLYATVVEAGDLVASDVLNHASMIDGMRLGPARRHLQPHLDPAVPPDTTLIALESLYSMDGDSPELARYPRGPWLALDEAHAFGALGPGGRGIAALQGVEPDFVVLTFGKALGVAGAAVLGPPILRELLLNRARSFVFTTGLPEAAVAAVLRALELADDERRARLAANVRRLRGALAEVGIPALGHAHIVPIVLGARTMAVSAALLDAGFHCPGIRAPTVPAGRERLRLTLSSEHRPEQIDQLVETLAALL